MSSFFQRLEPENQAQRARDQALHYIDNFPAVIINGEDITRGARYAVRRQIEAEHLVTLDSLEPRRGQFLGGLFAFFVEIARVKQNYKARIKEFKSATERIRYEALEAIEREVANRIFQEDTTKLLASRAGRLSNDAKRVANQMYRKSTEISRGLSQPTQSQQIIHHHMHQRIWERDDIEEFEKNQDQEAQVNHLQDAGTTRTTSPQGLPPPPRLARKFEYFEVQGPAEMVLPIEGNHRRGTFATFGSVSSGGSSGYEASSSGSSSRDSHQAAGNLDEDHLEDINVEAMYNNVSAILDMYHQDGNFGIL